MSYNIKPGFTYKVGSYFVIVLKISKNKSHYNCAYFKYGDNSTWCFASYNLRLLKRRLITELDSYTVFTK